MMQVDVRLKFNRHVGKKMGCTGSMMNNLLRSTVCKSVEYNLCCTDMGVRTFGVRVLIQWNSILI